jgi:hypothetical protein
MGHALFEEIRRWNQLFGNLLDTGQFCVAKISFDLPHLFKESYDITFITAVIL